MPTRRCLECRTLIAKGSRCARHEAVRVALRHREADMARSAVMARPWCAKCGATTDLTADHIVPLSRGGRAVPGNLQTLCRSCNSSKKDR